VLSGKKKPILLKQNHKIENEGLIFPDDLALLYCPVLITIGASTLRTGANIINPRSPHMSATKTF